MLRTVYLHGSLAALHPGPIQIHATTVAEAVEGISRQIEGLHRRRIAVVDAETIEDLFRFLPEDQTEIHIVPQLNGGKSGGFTQILIGAALVAASFIPGLNATVATMILQAGALAILGGLSQLLAPQPKADDEQEKNRYLGAPKNTVEIGTRIPILYGEFRCYGHWLGFDINAMEVKGSGASSGGGK